MSKPKSSTPDEKTSIDTLLDTVVNAFAGSRRDGQHQMANAVADAMDSGTHLLVQAGTGTGKSLGYLIPAIARASRGVSDQGDNRTIVATATLALQRQLVDEDLPTAVQALGSSVSYSVLKGRHNYVCLDKFHRDATVDDEDAALFESPTSRLGKQAKKLRTWVQTTDTGDRDDYDQELDPRLWKSISVSGRECIGAQKCAWGQDCFAEKARADANKSDIVITNHALLVLDVIEGIPILPEHDTVIVDEAHELVDRTTNALAGSIDVRAVERAAGLARKYIEGPTYERMLDNADELGRAFEVTDSFGTVTRIEEVSGSLHRALTDIRDIFKRALLEITTASTDEPEIAAAKKRAKAEVQDVMNIAGALLKTDEFSVTWLDISRTPTLHYAPLTVSAYLRDTLLARNTAIMTSATMTVGGSMDAIAKSVGLKPDSRMRALSEHIDDAPSEEPELEYVALDVGSPFDYAQQGILYCASHLPPPTSTGVAEEVLDELADLIDAAGGRTLSLFSSWRGVERAAEYLALRFKDRADRPIIVAQKGDSVADLVRKFKAESRSSLLGTVSLWQGIDVPGDTCTLVTIDRIPFPRPDDPVMSARAARVDARGGSGFASVSVPRAALLLAQGVGRLIRSVDDRGVVAILDSRLATKNYGATLRASLPPLWWTTDKSAVLQSLTRLDQNAN